MNRGERRRIERQLDRIEDRLLDAADGFHCTRPGATEAQLENSALPEDARLVWARWDGMDLAHGHATLFCLEEVATHTATHRESGLLREGDLAIGARGEDLFVFSYDPWEEGAAVVQVEDDGARAPMNASVEHFLLGQLAEISVLFDEEGEFQEGLFGDDGELLPAVHRRLLRRHLDFDEDAPLARLHLGQSLRRDGALRAAVTEFEAVVRRAPGFAWAQFELGRALVAQDALGPARAAFAAAMEAESDEALTPYFQAWQARCTSEPEARAALVDAVRAGSPEFVAQQDQAAQQAMEAGDMARAREHVALGLIVTPTSLPLLQLRRRLSEDAPPS